MRRAIHRVRVAPPPPNHGPRARNHRMCIMRKPLMVALAVAALALPSGLVAQTNQGTITASATAATEPPFSSTAMSDPTAGEPAPPPEFPPLLAGHAMPGHWKAVDLCLLPADC